jgi:hypothetical protein
MVLSADETSSMIPPTDPIPWGIVKADLSSTTVDDQNGLDLVGVAISYQSDNFVIDSKGTKYDALEGILVVDCTHHVYVLVDGVLSYKGVVVETVKHNKEFVRPASPVGYAVGSAMCHILSV